MAPHLGRQGIVIGAGMAGMPSARVLADYFDQVIVLESDTLPVDASPRPATPQSKHLHVLLAGGQQALSTLFPSFEGSLAAAGAQLLSVTTDYWMELPRYEVFPQRDLGIRTYSLTRPLVERVVRGKVTAIRNIEIRQRCRAQRLMTTEDGAAVNGVVCTHSSGETEEIPADLVIDASGSGQLTLNLLAALGLQGPEVSTCPDRDGVQALLADRAAPAARYRSDPLGRPDRAPCDGSQVHHPRHLPNAARRGLCLGRGIAVAGYRVLVGAQRGCTRTVFGDTEQGKQRTDID